MQDIDITPVLNEDFPGCMSDAAHEERVQDQNNVH